MAIYLLLFLIQLIQIVIHLIPNPVSQLKMVYTGPFISFRIISDIPLKDHKAQMYFDFWERMAEGSFEVTKAFLESI